MTFSEFQDRFVEILNDEYGKAPQCDISGFRALEIAKQIFDEDES
jgi:hypothetical protein